MRAAYLRRLIIAAQDLAGFDMEMSVRRLYVPRPGTGLSGIERHWMRRWGLTEVEARERMAQVRRRAVQKSQAARRPAP